MQSSEEKVRRYLRVWFGQRCSPADRARLPALCALVRRLDRVPEGADLARRRRLASQVEEVLAAMRERIESSSSLGVLDRSEMRLLRSRKVVEGFYMLAVVIGCVCLAFQIGKIFYTGSARALSLSYFILYFLSLALRVPYFILFPVHISLWYIVASALLVAILVGAVAWYHEHQEEPRE